MGTGMWDDATMSLFTDTIVRKEIGVEFTTFEGVKSYGRDTALAVEPGCWNSLLDVYTEHRHSCGWPFR